MGDRYNLPELPNGWVWTGLSVVCEKIQDGSHFSPQVQYNESGEGRYLYITAKNLASNGIDLSDVTFVDYSFHKTIYERCNPEKGDVLLTKDGVKTGVATINNLEEEFSLLSSVALFKTNKSLLNSVYLRYFLSSPVGFKMITGQMTGTAIKRIILAKLRQSYICLPPLAEQHRIVDKIEELFSELDAGVELLKKLKVKLKRYRQAVLKAAVEGKLTKDWREAHQGDLEPASVLLERILKERRQKWEAQQIAQMKAKGKTPKDDSWKLKYKEPVAPDISDLFELPDGWMWATVEQIVDVGTGATPLRSNPNYYELGTILWVTSGALNEAFVTQADERITELAIQETNAKVFPVHTLLVAMYGEGKTRGKVSELLIEAATNQACAALLFDGIASVTRPYIKIYFQKNYDDIRRLSSGGVQPNLNLGIIKATRIPLPPLEEQKQIVEELERIFSVNESLEKTIDQNIKRAERLRQSILKKAFEGKLVPQDSTDEPADKLLERIKAEKTKLETETKAKKKRKQQKKSQQLELF